MEDDSYKYLGHENLAELVAELRNKMGGVVSYVDLILLENSDDPSISGLIKRLKPKAEETMVKSMPLILRYLEEFEQYDLNIKRKS